MIPLATKDPNIKTGKVSESQKSDQKEENAPKESQETPNAKPPENMKPTPFMFGTPIFFNNISRYCFNKLYKKKQKPFTEREGDWICNNCKNLNFAFRVECNRCKLKKGADTKLKENSTEDNKINENNREEQKTYPKKERYNKYKKNSNNYYNNKNMNESGKE